MEEEHIPCCLKEDPRNEYLTKGHRIISNLEKSRDDHTLPCCPKEVVGNEVRQELSEPMGPIGPWATGQADWNPKGGLTGVRPVVDRYSITRFSTGEWGQRNSDLVAESRRTFQHSVMNENECKNLMARTHSLVDRNQDMNTKRLKARTHDVHKWKTTLERAIKAQIEEIEILESQRVRLKNSLSILEMPESIASECIDRRCVRPDSELIRDEPEEELIQEIALISEIRNVLRQTLKDIEGQQRDNVAARERLEYDWSDKKDAFEIETVNCRLNNKSTTSLLRPGATRFLDEQSSPEYWEHFTKHALEDCEECRQRSVRLRATLDAILMNAARDLRTKADHVERAFSRRIACIEEIRVKLENELVDVNNNTLRRLAEIEKLIDTLTRGMTNLDTAMKVAHSRLDNRNRRLHVENCRDISHIGLCGEVKEVQEGTSAMLAAIQQAEDTKNSLMNTRGLLEREIALKKRTIAIDKERCMLLRTHFPSATALSGFV